MIDLGYFANRRPIFNMSSVNGLSYDGETETLYVMNGDTGEIYSCKIEFVEGRLALHLSFVFIFGLFEKKYKEGQFPCHQYKMPVLSDVPFVLQWYPCITATSSTLAWYILNKHKMFFGMKTIVDFFAWKQLFAVLFATPLHQ